MPTDESPLSAVVSVHDVRVGQLDRLSDEQDFRFVFDPAWLEMANAPVLGQIFEDRRPDPIHTSGLPCWFDHLLPQGPSRRLFQRWLCLDEADDDSFTLLLGLGGDLPGAVTLAPGVPSLFGPGGYASPRVLPPTGPGFSLAGAQNKLSVRTGDSGLVVPARGERGEFIAKFHDPRFGNLPRLEWATTQWARVSGIRAHDARLVGISEFERLPVGLDPGDGDVFLATRFDRNQESRVHAEDFAQILDRPTQFQESYETVADALRWLAPHDLREYVERLAFMVVSGNGDAHLKNWGVLYPDRRRAVLGPAYDVISTVSVLPRDELALPLGGVRDFGSVRADSFDLLARRVGRDPTEIRKWATVARDRAVEGWQRESAHLPFTVAERERIEKHLRRVPFVQER